MRHILRTVGHPHQHLGRAAYRSVAALATLTAIAGNVVCLTTAGRGGWWIGMALVAPAAWLIIERLIVNDDYDAGSAVPPWGP